MGGNWEEEGHHYHPIFLNHALMFLHAFYDLLSPLTSLLLFRTKMCPQKSNIKIFLTASQKIWWILRFLYFCHVLCHDYYSIHFPSFLFIFRHWDLGTKIYKWPQENGPWDEIKMAVVMEGPLSKWTNVVKGWQYRWFVLDDNTGLLSYYTVSVISLSILLKLDRNCRKKTHLKNVLPWNCSRLF